MKSLAFYLALGLALLAVYALVASPTLRLLAFLVALVLAVGAIILKFFGSKIDLRKFWQAVHDLLSGL